MKIKVSDYIIKRLEKLGIKEIFGLPGDYNFNLLDSVLKNTDVNWINCTNELNSSYAADGYARIKGYGAVITTYGVGELSALNGIAGSFAENVPVMKITGTPETISIKTNEILHHNFANPDYYAFERIYSNVTETTAYLTKENAKFEIDRVFETFVKKKKPVYLAVPIDVCNLLIEDEIPEVNIKSDNANLKIVVNKIKEIINNSKNPLFIADYLLKRFRLKDEIIKLVEKTNIKITSMIMGKGLINEDNKNYIGVNYGEISDEDFKKFYYEADLIIALGMLYSDLNTSGYAVMKDERFKIEIQADSVTINNERYENIYIEDVVKGLLNLEDLHRKTSNGFNFKGYDKIETSDMPVKTNEIFPLLQDFTQENDTLVIETGIIAVASSKIKLKRNSNYITQTLWGSIGWATPAAFGAAMADKSKRLVLFTGEGSHQLTIQELANMFKFKIKPVIILLNNSGYTIERVLSGKADDVYNNITAWNYKEALNLFGNEYSYYRVCTSNELKKAFELAGKEQKEKLQYIEIFTDKMDAPDVTIRAINHGKKYKNKNFMIE